MTTRDDIEWDPMEARSRAEEDLTGQDCTACAEGIDDAMEAQGWEMDGVRLWWQPGWSPDSFVQLMGVAQWTAEATPQAPVLKAIVYDPEGRLVRIDDLAPYQGMEGRQMPRTIAFEEIIHLIGSGPGTVPGRIRFVIGETESRSSPDDYDFDFSKYQND